MTNKHLLTACGYGKSHVIFTRPNTYTVTDILVTVDRTQEAFILPNSVQIVEESAFEGNPAITSVFVPDSCTSIGANAFKDCVNLSQIRLPRDCDIDASAFEGCTSLAMVFAPEGGDTEQWALRIGIQFYGE